MADAVINKCILYYICISIWNFSLSYTVQSTTFIIISWQALYPLAFTQLLTIITGNHPPQHSVPTPCTAHDSYVNTFFPWNRFLQCHVKCAVVNLNICIIISSILKLCDIICVLWNTFNLTSVCSSLSTCDTRVNTACYCLCRYDSTALPFKHYIWFKANSTHRRSLEEVNGYSGNREILCMLCTPQVHCGGHNSTQLAHNITEPDVSNRHSSILFLWSPF